MESRIKLAEYFNELGFHTGAEVGTAAGAYALILCQKIPGLRLFCIDPWEKYKENQRGGSENHQHDNYETTKRVLASYNVKLVREMSMDAVKKFGDESLDFVFIDGNHNYPFVKEDIAEWSKKVRKGGIVATHDFYHFHRSGVIEAVTEYCSINRIDFKLTDWDWQKKLSRDNRVPCAYWFKT